MNDPQRDTKHPKRRGGKGRRGIKPKILSAGVVLIRRVDDQWRFLLLRAYRYWDFPKGKCERGEQPIAAAIRETEEETTITQLEFKWGEDYFETGPYAQGKVARYYIAETKQADVKLPVNPELGRAEHDEFKWVDYDTAERIVSPRVQQVLRWASRIIGK